MLFVSLSVNNMMRCDVTPHVMWCDVGTEAGRYLCQCGHRHAGSVGVHVCLFERDI